MAEQRPAGRATGTERSPGRRRTNERRGSEITRSRVHVCATESAEQGGGGGHQPRRGCLRRPSPFTTPLLLVPFHPPFYAHSLSLFHPLSLRHNHPAALSPYSFHSRFAILATVHRFFVFPRPPFLFARGPCCRSGRRREDASSGNRKILVISSAAPALRGIPLATARNQRKLCIVHQWWLLVIEQL